MYRLIFLSIFIVSGCSNSPKIAFEQLSQAAICCQTFGHLTAVKMTARQQHNIVINNHNQVRMFDLGVSYFELLELPQASSSVFIRSWVPQDSVTGADLFYPVLLLLDRDLKIITTVRPIQAWPDGFQFYLTDSILPKMYMTTTMNLPSAARYAVVHTDYNKINATTLDLYGLPVIFSAQGQLTFWFE
ncbi:MAG: hypothetical protein HRU22_07100 [Gammaproteobacteria bacterium]|nr:hypothetical protein [Gammaproteobacteria bacterium]